MCKLPPHEHLKKAREGSGKTRNEIADAIGANVESYCDLEDGHDLYNGLDLNQIFQLCQSLSLKLERLFEQEEDAWRGIPSNFNDLADRIHCYLEQCNRPLAEVEDEVGWDLGDVIGRPADMSQWCIDQLKAYSEKVNIGWLDVLIGEFEQRAK